MPDISAFTRLRVSATSLQICTGLGARIGGPLEWVHRVPRPLAPRHYRRSRSSDRDQTELALDPGTGPGDLFAGPECVASVASALGAETRWLVSGIVVLAGELALLLHELSHAFVARGHGQEVTRIIFHGFQAETIAAVGLPAPAHEALIALSGPGMNVALAGLTQAVRIGLATQGPLDVALLLLVLGNIAMAAMSLLPVGGSDGGRALGALRRSRNSGCR